ncbi:MAG: hypothetical protein EHM40_04710 [Chloroflexi bacterium]|nr:MAG: hypothetical protein EHM40_04710 [Chloroflexota bacterium]
MEFGPQDQAIARLLTALKQGDDEYPENMLVTQRRSYLKRMTEIQSGIRAEKGARNTVDNTNSPHGSPVGSTLLEAALIVAIVAEASVMAYFYRDRLTDFFETLTEGSRVQEVTPSPVLPASPELQGVSPSLATTSTSPITTMAGSFTAILITSTGTPVPGIPVDITGTADVSQLDSTPVPDGNNGNHYGQTPKPERTRENDENNDKPPKDKEDKPPKDREDKPPKDK